MEISFKTQHKFDILSPKFISKPNSPLSKEHPISFRASPTLRKSKKNRNSSTETPASQTKSNNQSKITYEKMQSKGLPIRGIIRLPQKMPDIENKHKPYVERKHFAKIISPLESPAHHRFPIRSVKMPLIYYSKYIAQKRMRMSMEDFLGGSSMGMEAIQRHNNALELYSTKAQIRVKNKSLSLSPILKKQGIQTPRLLENEEEIRESYRKSKVIKMKKKILANKGISQDEISPMIIKTHISKKDTK